MSKPLGITILDFFEHPACLNLKGVLSPAQRITLKAIYGLPLDKVTPIDIEHDFQKINFKNEVDMFLWLSGKDEYIEGQRFSDISLCVGRRCLGKGTKVSTPNGPVNIECIQEGDIVYGYNEDMTISETEVTSTHDQGTQTLREILSDGKWIASSTQTHKWLTKSGTITMGELISGNEISKCVGSKSNITLGNLYTDKSYDIRVDNETSLYVLANGGLITHNSGKSTFIGAGIALYQATQFDYSPYLGTSPFATIPLVSPTTSQGNEVFQAIKLMIIRSPYIFNEFMGGNLEGFMDEYDENHIGKDAKIIGKAIHFNNKVVIKVLPADISNIRGFASPFWIMDEACFMGSELGDSKNTDVGIFEALDPTTAQFEDIAFGLKISSPNGESGLMYNDYEKRKDPDVLHIQSPTWYFNTTITSKYLEKKKKKGMSYFNREYGAQYTSSESSYLDPKLVESTIIRGMKELDYIPNFRYVAAIDYATKHDYWTLAIGHKEYIYDPNEKTKKEYIYMDKLMHWKGTQGSELDPSEVIPEICNYLKQYRVGMCLADQYAFAALRSMFQREGCTLKEHAASSSSKIKYMYSLQVAVNSGALRMVHEPLAVKHLKDLREKRTKSGTIRIEHANGSHDDYCSVIALCVYQFDKTSPVFIGLSQEDADDTPTTKDAKGNFITMPTATDLADHVGLGNDFNDNRAERKLEENGGEDEEGDFWFVF